MTSHIFRINISSNDTTIYHNLELKINNDHMFKLIALNESSNTENIMLNDVKDIIIKNTTITKDVNDDPDFDDSICDKIININEKSIKKYLDEVNKLCDKLYNIKNGRHLYDFRELDDHQGNFIYKFILIYDNQYKYLYGIIFENEKTFFCLNINNYTGCENYADVTDKNYYIENNKTNYDNFKKICDYNEGFYNSFYVHMKDKIYPEHVVKYFVDNNNIIINGTLEKDFENIDKSFLDDINKIFNSNTIKNN